MMPAYDYSCKNCGHTTEVRHSMNKAPEITCSKCQQPMVKAISFPYTRLCWKQARRNDDGLERLVLRSAKNGVSSPPDEKAAGRRAGRNR